MSYLRTAFRGASVSFVMAILAALVSYFTRVILARNLGPTYYGLFYAVVTFVVFFLFFRDLGLGQALVKYVSHARALKRSDIASYINTPFIIQIGSSIILGTILFFTADWLAESYFNNPAAAIMLKLLIIYVIGSVFFRIQKQTFQAFQQMLLYSSVEFSKNLFVLLGLLVFMSFGYVLFAPVFAYIAASILLSIVYFPFFLRIVKISSLRNISTFSRKAKQMVRYGIPVLSTSVGGKIIGYIDTLLLTYFVSLQDVGIYNAVLPSAIVLLFFGRSISSMIFPLSAELWAKKDITRLRSGLELVHRGASILLLPVIITLWYFSTFVITFVFGPAYSSGFHAFQILLLGVFLYVTVQSNNSVLSGMGKPKYVMYIVLTSAAMNVLLNLLLIPKLSIIGAAIATTCSYVLAFLLSMFLVHREMDVPITYSVWGKVLLLTGIGFTIGMFIRSVQFTNPWFHMAILLLTLIAVTLVGAHIVRLVTFREIQSYLRQLRKRN